MQFRPSAGRGSPEAARSPFSRSSVVTTSAPSPASSFSRAGRSGRSRTTLTVCTPARYAGQCSLLPWVAACTVKRACRSSLASVSIWGSDVRLGERRSSGGICDRQRASCAVCRWRTACAPAAVAVHRHRRGPVPRARVDRLARPRTTLAGSATPSRRRGVHLPIWLRGSRGKAGSVAAPWGGAARCVMLGGCGGRGGGAAGHRAAHLAPWRPG